MKTSIRNLILAGVTGVSLISASVALAGCLYRVKSDQGCRLKSGQGL